jgi:hypothetical protein
MTAGACSATSLVRARGRAVRALTALAIAGGLAHAATLAQGKPPAAHPLEHITDRARRDAIRRADVWSPTDVPSMNLRTGPQGKGSFAPFATVPCDFVDKQPGGTSAKFTCALATGDDVKVKYGRGNVEVFAEVAATRLLWALGFGADHWYPVTVICRGCPADPFFDMTHPLPSVTFDVAAIERTMPGKTMETRPDEGWDWTELNELDPVRGYAESVQRDALTLLAVLLQHTDSKPQQQRLICLPGGARPDSDVVCSHPFMLIHDAGLTFGRANAFNRNEASGANFQRWAGVPVWKDPKRCIGKLSASFGSDFSDPLISEAGRKFLADLLVQLSDAQLRDMFEVGRFEAHSGVPIAEWVKVFKAKRDEIVNRSCGR